VGEAALEKSEKGRRVKRASKALVALCSVVALAVLVSTASAARLPGTNPGPKSPYEAFSDSIMAPADVSGDTYSGSGNNNAEPGRHDTGRGGNTFVNDPCRDAPVTLTPSNRRGTVQSETEIAVFGKYMVAGWNDSLGFYDNREGLAGFGYSTNGGNTWIDGGGLPPVLPTGAPASAPTNDGYFGDPVLVVDKSARVFTKDSLGNTLATPIRQAAGQFYYNAIYKMPNQVFTLSVNRGRFLIAPPTTPETASNTRCANKPEEQGIADTSNLPNERIVWELPVSAVLPPYLGPTNADFLDKNWMHVDERTGTLYVTYTRFASDGSSPIELVRSFDGGRTWTPPSVIVPNEALDFNQATYPVTVALPGGGTRVIVYWWARTFNAVTGAVEDRRIEYAISNDNGTTFGPEVILDTVGSTGEPPGYNRARTEILNAPFAHVRGNTVAVTYIDGRSAPLTGAAGGPRPSDTIARTSHDGGLTYGPVVAVNDDAPGVNTHVFPSVQINKHGDIYIAWLDRRNDPNNILTETWANVSKDGGVTFGHDKLQSDVATSWFVRADARPNFGDYNSSELIDDNQFVTIWADGRFPGPVNSTCAPGTGVACPPGSPGPQNTPDTIFTIAQGLGVGNG